MSDLSTRLSLPLIRAAQAQKHVTHNEAIVRLDLLVQLSIQAFDLDIPPATPAEGQAWTVGTSPTDAWADLAPGTVAAFTNGGWLDMTPNVGWRAWGIEDGALRTWTGTAWTAEGGGAATMSQTTLGINTTADATNRLAVSAPATLLTHEGGSHRVVINKADVSDTASLLYQSDWSGRAEMGLAGDDSFSIKVSADGVTWADALIAAGDGGVGLGITPVRQLHVGDAMRLEPGIAPADPEAGDIYFDAATSTLRCHDGTTWHDLF